MKTKLACGVIAEFNPFHLGHAYFLQEARKLTGCETLIVVLSGNYVQRGEPALCDKWLRTQMALTHGADLVFELPTLYATQAANQFGRGAVALLELAQVDSLVFGSESGNLEELQEMASAPVNPDHIREALDQGQGFPSSYGLLTPSMYPNDILAVAYLKALQGTAITPYVLPRTNAYHSEELQNISSATALRKAAFEQTYPENEVMASALANYPLRSMDSLYPYIRYSLETLDADTLATLFLFSEGIEQHLKKCASQSGSYAQFINQATTRRYTTSRIRRCLIQLLNHVTQEEAHAFGLPSTLRILGFNSEGQAYLQKLKEQEVPLASRFGDCPNLYRKLEMQATRTYCLGQSEEERQRCIEKEIGSPIILR